MKTLYKFLRTGLKSQHGNCTWKIGEWKHEDAISLCNCGFHASVRAIDALSYVPGEVLAVVEVKGKRLSHTDKQVWTDMRIVRAYKWTKQDSVELAVFAAEQVIEIYEKHSPNDGRSRKAIKAAKAYLENPSDTRANAAARADTRANAAAYAAYAAANAAAYAANAAANAAAYAAAYAADYAARAAAYTAADVANAAARAAAAAAILDKINDWMIARIPSLEEIK